MKKDNIIDILQTMKEFVLTTKSQLAHDIPVVFAAGTRYINDFPKQLMFTLTDGESMTRSPLNIVINAADAQLITRAAEIINKANFGMLEVVNRVCFDKKQGVTNEAIPTAEILKRWEKYIDWVVKHYPEYGNHQFDWLFKSGHPDNYPAWAARAILGDIKPGPYTNKLIREGKVVFGEDGYARLTKPLAVFNFEYSDATHSVGQTGYRRLTGGDFDCCFESNSRIARCTKVPEQWEIDEGVFVKFDIKKGLFK